MQYEGNEGVKIAPPTPAPKVDYSKNSDEELLGVDPEAPALGDLPLPIDHGKNVPKPEVEKKPETVQLDEENRVVKPTEEAVKEKAPEAKEETKDEEIEPLPYAVSPEMEQAFTLPTVGKDIRQAVFGYKAYQEVFPTVSVAREIQQMFPTVEEAKSAIDSMSVFADMQSKFNDDPKDFVTTLAEEGEPFRKMVEHIDEAHFKADPDHYAKVGLERFRQAIAYFANRRDLSENQEAALDVVARMAFGRPIDEVLEPPTEDPKDKEIARLKAERERRPDYVHEVQGFREDVEQQAPSIMKSSIREMVDSIAGDNSAITPDARVEMVDKIYRNVAGSIRKNQAFKVQLDAAIARGDLGDRHFTDVINMLLMRGNTLARQEARTVIPSYTKKVLNLNSETREKQRLQGTRRDIGLGGSGPRAPGIVSPAITPDQIDYRHTSDEDIFADRVVLKPNR